jgi:hypothetical protein
MPDGNLSALDEWAGYAGPRGIGVCIVCGETIVVLDGRDLHICEA